MAESGAIDVQECPTRSDRPYRGCSCTPTCAICGDGPHWASHGPYYGQPIGTTPFGHAYVPDSPTAAPK